MPGRLVLGLLFTGVSLIAGTQATTAVTRSVYFTATDSRGLYVDDLRAAELVVKDGGKVREILRTGPSADRVKITLAIDDSLSPNDTVRRAAADLAERLQDSADIALYLVGNGAAKIVDFGSTPVQFRQALNEIPRRPQGGGSLVDALYQIIGETRRLEGRRVVVVLATTAAQRSSVTANGVLDQLRDTGAVLHAATLASSIGVIEPPTPEMAHLEVSEEVERDRVLNEGPKQSGGLRMSLLNMEALAGALDRIRNELQHQCVVSYVIPAGAKTDGRLSIESTRKGVTVRGPRQLPKI
jgi:hypothetical protein